MRALLTIMIIAYFLVSNVILKAGAAEPSWQADGKTYKLVCDPSNSAAFLRGLVGKAQCIYMETSTIDYMKKHDKPCDSTFTGQFLKGFLGRACETTKNLNVSEENYDFYRLCDEAFWNQFKAGLLSRDPCKYKYQVRNLQEYQRPAEPLGSRTPR